MSRPTLRTLGLTTLAMVAFAGNSLLCRAALRDTEIDAATFTSVRLLSGALMLWFLLSVRGNRAPTKKGSWGSALALFAYAATFSYAYGGLSAAMGALLLFGAVQATMISIGIVRGNRPGLWQWAGFAIAFSGLIGLLLPGLTAPPFSSSLLMISAGVAWGIYSLRAKGAGEPTAATTGNFIRTVPMALVLSLVMMSSASIDMAGVGFAVASGAIASGMGYAVWYMALPLLQATTAATVQLSVPVIAALGGVLLLSEPLTLRLVVAGIAILGGIAIVIRSGQKKTA